MDFLSKAIQNVFFSNKSFKIRFDKSFNKYTVVDRATGQILYVGTKKNCQNFQVHHQIKKPKGLDDLKD